MSSKNACHACRLSVPEGLVPAHVVYRCACGHYFVPAPETPLTRIPDRPADEHELAPGGRWPARWGP